MSSPQGNEEVLINPGAGQRHRLVTDVDGEGYDQVRSGSVFETPGAGPASMEKRNSVMAVSVELENMCMRVRGIIFSCDKQLKK